MEKIIKYVTGVPAYLKYMWNDHFVLTIILLSLFLLVAFFNFKFVPFIRKVVVAGLILLGLVGAINGRRQHGYQMLCTAVIFLVVLLLVRILMNEITEIRRSRLNARIEKRQLERARTRRGDFSKRRGYSGKTRPTETPTAVETMVRADIEEIIGSKLPDSSLPEKETWHSSEEPKVPILPGDETAALPEGIFYARPNTEEKHFDGNSVLAADIYEALLKLGKLKEQGIITELEFQKKKTELLEKIR